MNSAALLELADFLESPECGLFNMGRWSRKTPCGTFYCAVGWAAFKGIGGLKLEHDYIRKDDDLGWDAVLSAFDLDLRDAVFLFDSESYNGGATANSVSTRIRRLVERES